MKVLVASDVLVVVPALNEQKTIGSVVSHVRDSGFDVLVVSDGSTDRTASIARESGARVMELPINLGVGGALRAGFKFAVRHKYQAVVQVDADGQHPVTDILNLIKCANSEDADLVIGSRFLTTQTTMKISSIREFAMKRLASSASRATDTRITDATSGFRLICEPLLTEFSRNFASNYLGDTYEAIISAGRAGYRIREVGAPIAPRLEGQSSASTFHASVFTAKCLFNSVLHFHLRLRPRNPKIN